MSDLKERFRQWASMERRPIDKVTVPDKLIDSYSDTNKDISGEICKFVNCWNYLSRIYLPQSPNVIAVNSLMETIQKNYGSIDGSTRKLAAMVSMRHEELKTDMNKNGLLGPLNGSNK